MCSRSYNWSLLGGHSLGSSRNLAYPHERLLKPREHSLTRNCDATRRGTRPCNLPRNDTALVTLRWRHLTAVHKDEIDDFHRTPTSSLLKRSKKMENFLFLECLASRDNKELHDSIQKTFAYRQITWRIILQPDLAQSHDYKDSDETSVTCLRHTGQLMWRKQIPWTCFSQKKLQRWLN